MKRFRVVENKRKETINHPSHYGGDTVYEAIKVIEAWGLGFCLGNAVKYICRADTKGMKMEDLRKARWYIDREIQRLERSDVCETDKVRARDEARKHR